MKVKLIPRFISALNGEPGEDSARLAEDMNRAICSYAMDMATAHRPKKPRVSVDNF